MLNFIFIDSINFGDAVNQIFWEKIINLKIEECNKNKLHFITTGSILSLLNNNSIILGSGFISQNNDIGGNNFFSNTNKLLYNPYSILAVRGPLTRQKFLQHNIYCPEVYGDPLILMPCIYNNIVNISDNIIGIIPHYIDKTHHNIFKLKQILENNGYIINIIDIEIGADYKNFIDNINKCKYIISSSLHGIITGLIYKKYTIYFEFSKNIIGDNFKFNDFFASLNINYQYKIDYSINILNNIINIDYNKLNQLGCNLINVCPFISDKRKTELINIYNSIYNNHKSNLIITTLINYDYDIHYRFIATLFNHINNVKLVLFISKNDEKHIIKIKHEFPNIEYNIIDINNIHVVNLRFKLYYDYLTTNINQYNLVFLCDSRDVLFQKDIFKHPIINNNYDLYIFEEETLDITIDKCQFNSLYVKKSCLNIEHIVKNKNIICVGTILGNSKGILEYLYHFTTILDNEIPETQKNQYGVDSGINYKIIYSNLLNNINIKTCTNSDKLVYTTAFPIHLNLIDYDNLLNQDNKIMYKNDLVYCVHQYDRFPDIIKNKMSTKYNFMI